MKRTLVIGALSLLLAMAVGPACAYEAFHGPSETIWWEPAKAANGYNITGRNMFDMNGNIVYQFVSGGRLYPDGTFYGEGSLDFKKTDWDGNVIFDLTEDRSNHHPHHDSILVKNKKLGRDTVIYISNKDYTHDEIIAAGANPAWKKSYSGSQMDCLVERDSLTNQVVWEWCMYDHLVQDLDKTKKNYVGAGKKISDYPNRMNINYGKVVGGDWNHCNGLDYNDDNGHIVFDMVWGEMWIIDHDGTFVSSAADFAADATKAAAANVAAAASSKGDFLWRFGDPAIYQQGIRPEINTQTWISLNTHDKQMGKTHDAQWIRNLSSTITVPGAGNILINNGADYCFDEFPQTGALEVNPYLKGRTDPRGLPFPYPDLSDTYVNPPDVGYYTWQRRSDFGSRLGTYKVNNQVVWFFRNRETSGSFEDNGGCVIRLWNGNTLISSKTEGHYYEVTVPGEVVWEYINPTTPDGPQLIIKPGMLDRHSAGRIWRYPYDYPVFQGKDIYPRGTLTGRAPYVP